MDNLLYPPSFTAGLSPKDLLDTDEGEQLQLQYGRDMAVTMILLRHQRRALAGLLDGVVAPDDEAQARFLALAQQGHPVALEEEIDSPRLFRSEAGWVCELNGEITADYPTVAECLQAYAQGW